MENLRQPLRQELRPAPAAGQPSVRFCVASCGTRLAYADEGAGPVIVKAGNSFTHVTLERSSPLWGPWLAEIGRNRRLIRYDMRGSGLSDRGCAEWSFEHLVKDLETVVESAGVERFALYGFSSGASVAVAFAARHPERVSHLVLQAGNARGRDHRQSQAGEREMHDTISNVVRFSLSHQDPFNGLFANLFIPDSTPEQMDWLRNLRPSDPSDAAQLIKVIWSSNVTAEAEQIACPTLVFMSAHNALTPFEEGRLLAGLIPGAELVELDSRNHLALSHETAWHRWVQALQAFLPGHLSRPGPLAALSPREVELMGLVAQGLDNLQIAAHLSLREKTVRNMVSRLYAKLQVEGRAQAIVLAREAGFGI
jgi:pimeloyl-ACP methyl ester carboxylesterase